MKNPGVLKDRKKKLHFKENMFAAFFTVYCNFSFIIIIINYKLNFVISTQMYKNKVYKKFGVSMVAQSVRARVLEHVFLQIRQDYYVNM